MLDLVMETFGRDVMYCLPYPTARAPDILCCLSGTVPHDKSFNQARMGIKGRRKEKLFHGILHSRLSIVNSAAASFLVERQIKCIIASVLVTKLKT